MMVGFTCRFIFVIYNFCKKVFRRIKGMGIVIGKKILEKVLFMKKTIASKINIKDKEAEMLSNNVIYLFLKLVKTFSEKKVEIQILNVKSVREYCLAHGQKYKVVKESSDCKVCLPAYFEMCDEKIETYSSPEIYIAEISDATICGGSSVILSYDDFLNDIMANDIENRLDIKFSNIIGKYGNKYIVIKEKASKVIGKGVFLLGFASYNYYHFTVEIMSRLRYIDAVEEYRDLPLVVDSCMVKTKQFKNMLDLFNVYKREIIPIDLNECIQVGELIYPSYNTWMPINVRKREMIRDKDFIIEKSCLQNIRSYVRTEKRKVSKKKIFISRRNVHFSRLENEESIVNIFKKIGFEIVYPEELTYLQQVRLFEDSEYVVGTSGAALTNIVYCNTDTHFICIIPEEYKFYMYSTIGHMLGMKVVFLNADITVRTACPAMDIFRLDEEYCLRFCKESFM